MSWYISIFEDEQFVNSFLLKLDTSETFVTHPNLDWFMILPKSITAHDYFKDEIIFVVLQYSHVPFYIKYLT